MINGWAKFVDKNTIDVNGEKYTADRFLIAVGMPRGLIITHDVPGIRKGTGF